MRTLLVFIALAFLAPALAGCLGAGPREGGAGSEPRAGIPADLAMEGAEVLARNADSVTFLWRGVASSGTYPGPPFEPLVAVDAPFPVPAGLPLLVTVALTWADTGADLDLRVVDAAGATACEQIGGLGPAGDDGNETCSVPVPEPLPTGEAWSARVAAGFAAADAPFEVRVTLARLALPAEDVRARFSEPLLLGGGGHGETSLVVGPDGTMLACTHGFFRHPSPAWASEDDGATWRALDPQPNPLPSGDCDVAVMDDGAWVIVYDTVASATVATSNDRGATWSVFPLAALPVGGVDRPWILAHGPDLLLTYSDLASALPSLQFFTRSSDGGRSWSPPVLMTRASDPAKPNKVPGHLFADGDVLRVPVATLDASRPGPQDFGLLVSRDAGATWSEETLLRDVEAPIQFPSATRAPDGTLYYALTTGPADAADARIRWSLDDGATWTEPLAVASGLAFPGVATAWVDARADGSASVAWMHAEGDAWRTSVARVDPRAAPPLRYSGPVTDAHESRGNEFVMVRHDALGRARILTHASDAACEDGLGPLATRECILLVSETPSGAA